MLTSNKTTNILWPMPKNLETNTSATPLIISPCRINYKITSPSNILIQEIVTLYMIQVFKCSQQPKANITLNIVVKNTDQMIATNVSQEKYSLILR
jgi:hypothetical protein